MPRKITAATSKIQMDTKSTSTVPESKSAPEEPEEPVLAASSTSGLRMGSLLRTWAEVSRINYMSSQPLDIITSSDSIRRRTIGIPAKEFSIQNFVPLEFHNKSEEDLFSEQFPVNITPLMNEDQLWGCFYIFPEIYADVYSPVVRIRNVEDVPEIIGGALTRDMVTACLSYLKRTPILGDFVYIKLDVTSKFLMNIDVLQHYKYLVYLDLSSNLLTELNVLSHLLYLQFLSVAFNRLNTVLEYDTPQWFLTEVHYTFNSVTKIRDLTMFWSITILDLSHNNIKFISGLESLRYLRRLDLSFNHIQRLENLNHLRLLWLDVSYNNISTFEISQSTGLWTLLHLEYLNLNENNLTSMKMFSGCTRLRELHVRNNSLSMLLELAVYMRQIRRLIIIDLRANPICATPGYRDVVINTFPILLSLDAEELDPVVQRSYKMEMTPDINTFASRRLLRLLYIEHLSRAHLSPYVPPADATEVPLVVLVGVEAVGKGTLAARLAEECSEHVELGHLHTTAAYHLPERYKEVSRDKFDDMLLAGDFLTYSETDGDSYGLSREEAFINEGRLKVVCMDLVGALMLKQRGLRPYLILITRLDKRKLIMKQRERKAYRDNANEQRLSLEQPMERSTLQVLLSGRIIITGILNEILLSLPEDKEKSEFLIESECSLLMDSEQRQAANDYVRGFNLLTLLASSTTSLEEACKQGRERSEMNPSLYSLYKESQAMDSMNNSFANGQNSFQDRSHGPKHPDGRQSRSKFEKPGSLSRPKSVDFSRYASSTWKVPESSKSSKSVTFTSQDNGGIDDPTMDPSGMLIEPPHSSERDGADKAKAGSSISTKVRKTRRSQMNASASGDDMDLWLAFLQETGLLQASSLTYHYSDLGAKVDIRLDDPESIIKQLADYHKEPCETNTTNIRDEYEEIHRKCPGLFWDTELKTVDDHRNSKLELLCVRAQSLKCKQLVVTTDNFNNGFHKLKEIVHNIYKSQPNLKPMFDIDFANLNYYPTVEKKLDSICKEIAPHRLFY